MTILPVAGELRGGLAVALAARAKTLADYARAADEQALAARLADSVAGPLERLATRVADGAPEDARDEGALEDAHRDAALHELAEQVAAQCVADVVPIELLEAAAALLDLTAADPVPSAAVVADAVRDRIQLVPGGPIVLVGSATVTDYLGCTVADEQPVRAFCRCGVSEIKPICDGACHRSGWTDDKDPNRVPDRRDTYDGLQVTVLDNRGLCQHSGLCTDRLSSVFHSDSEPFVTASGGRMDEIVRAVRDCPSGALGFALDGVEARKQTDHHDTRPPAVTISCDGPYRVTGGIPVLDGDGVPVPRNEGASQEHCALCRCGHSQNKPFCSGMHWYVGFKDPVRPEEPTIFEWAGGFPAFERMTRFFYEKYVPNDPLLSPIFSQMATDHPQRVAAWLGEVFCGPHAYSGEFGGYTRMISQHLGKHLTEAQRRRWVELLTQSAVDAGLPNDAEFRSAFGSYIEWGSRLAVENSQAESHPPQHMPMPHWDWLTAAGPPGGRISALAPPSAEPEAAVVLPGADEPVSFATHVKPLFRLSDRRSMSFVFDLWSVDDVRTHGPAILTRLEEGTMPCDGAWPAERVQVFQRWLAEGSAD